jgi:tetratricopeptide (TPR) repeat protein
MESINKRNFLLRFFLSLLLCSLVILFLFGLNWYFQARALAASVPTSLPQETEALPAQTIQPTSSPTIALPNTVTPSPTADASDQDIDEYLNSMRDEVYRDPEGIMNTLLSQVDDFDSDIHKAQAYVVIGMAKAISTGTLEYRTNEYLDTAEEMAFQVIANTKSVYEMMSAYQCIFDVYMASGNVDAHLDLEETFLETITPLIEESRNTQDLNQAMEYFQIELLWSFASTGIEQELNDAYIKAFTAITERPANDEELIKALEALVNLYYLMKQYQFAAAYQERLVEIDPTPYNFLGLARTYLIAGNNACAYKYFEMATADTENSLTDKDWNSALEQMRQIKQLYNNNVPDCP